MSESSFFLSFFFFFFLNHEDYVLIVYVLLLEHSHEVVSTSPVYFVKLVLDVCWPNFHFGGKKCHTSQAMQA